VRTGDEDVDEATGTWLPAGESRGVEDPDQSPQAFDQPASANRVRIFLRRNGTEKVVRYYSQRTQQILICAGMV
jgi:hypothetical protein